MLPANSPPPHHFGPNRPCCWPDPVASPSSTVLHCTHPSRHSLYPTPVTPQEALELVRPDALRVYVGKRGGRESIKQHQIDQLLVEHCTKARAAARGREEASMGCFEGGGDAAGGSKRGPRAAWPAVAQAGWRGAPLRRCSGAAHHARLSRWCSSIRLWDAGVRRMAMRTVRPHDELAVCGS